MTGATGEELLENLQAALGGEGPEAAKHAAALRMRVRLQPAGGSGSKVMPPTYAGTDDGGQQRASYVTEARVIGGEQKDCILLDSVASQANRMEEALEEELDAGQGSQLPRVFVDQGDWGRHSALAFPHRVFDAHIEDALLDGDRFGTSETFEALATASRKRALPLMERFPIGLVLGVWASRSKHPQGATRIARLLSSELIAVGAREGARIASRIDPHPISNQIEVFEAEGSRITIDSSEARKEKGEPVKFKGEGKAGRPSQAGYGNIAPTLADHGGVTMEYGLQICTLSLAGARECRFSEDGTPNPERDVAGRVMLAALGVHLLGLLLERGYDLRSGCLLVPEGDPQLELVGRLGDTPASWPLAEIDTRALLATAAQKGREQGFEWVREPLELEASPQQLALLKASQLKADTAGE